MFTILVLKLHHFFETQTALTHIAIIAQIVNMLVVFALFEHHWIEVHNEENYDINSTLIDKLDKATYDTFRYAFIFFSVSWVYVYFRSRRQKFSSARFVRDYGVKRSW